MRDLLGATAALAIGLLGSAGAGAQCAPPAWSGIAPGTDWGVEALLVYDGDLIAGGAFLTIGGVVANGIARWDGAAWHPVGTGVAHAIAGVPGVVSALAVYNGKLIAGGDFLTAGGVVVHGIASWDGSAWQALGTGVGGLPSTDRVTALAIYNGELIAGGYFQTAGGVLAYGVARWNGTSWQGTGLPVQVSLSSLAVHNGELIAAGIIPQANAIARWNGSSWQTLGTGLTGQPNSPSSPGYVKSLTVYGGELIVGGFFEFAGGVSVKSIARWNGGFWQPVFASGTTGITYAFGVVDALGTWNGDLVAGGRFTAVDGVPASGIGRWDGSTWQPLGAGLGVPASEPFSYYADAVAEFRGSLCVGGWFSTAGGIASPYLARWASPSPYLSLSQPGGAGTGVLMTNGWLVPGREYFNLYSLELAPGGLGTGPYSGLFFSNVLTLIQQVLVPVGSPPFHVVAASATETHGPFVLPAGLAFEMISVDVTSGVVGCISPAVGYTVQ